MDFVSVVIDLFLRLDQHLAAAVESCGLWIYGLLTLIIFAETGLVVTPFLPGDSLLFAAGALSAKSVLSAPVLFVLLGGAAVLGDTANYWVGQRFGAYLVGRHSRLLRPEHLARTHAFFEKYGGKTIVIARFVPIVRTLAPFVAGMGAMSYGRFLMYNVVGGVMWVAICLGAGYFFGNLPVVKEHFSLVILAIIAISIMPGVVGYLRVRFGSPARPAPSSAVTDKPRE